MMKTKIQKFGHLFSLATLSIALTGCDQPANDTTAQSKANATAAPAAIAAKQTTLLCKVDGQPWAYDKAVVTTENDSYKSDRKVIRLTFIQNATPQRYKNWVLITFYADTGKLRHISYDKAMPNTDGTIKNVNVNYDAAQAAQYGLDTNITFHVNNGMISGEGYAEAVAFPETDIRATVSDLKFSNLDYPRELLN